MKRREKYEQDNMKENVWIEREKCESENNSLLAHRGQLFPDGNKRIDDKCEKNTTKLKKNINKNIVRRIYCAPSWKIRINQHASREIIGTNDRIRTKPSNPRKWILHHDGECLLHENKSAHEREELVSWEEHIPKKDSS